MRKEHYGFIKSIGRVIGILDLDDFATESEIACFKQRNWGKLMMYPPVAE